MWDCLYFKNILWIVNCYQSYFWHFKSAKLVEYAVTWIRADSSLVCNFGYGHLSFRDKSDKSAVLWQF